MALAPWVTTLDDTIPRETTVPASNLNPCYFYITLLRVSFNATTQLTLKMEAFAFDSALSPFGRTIIQMTTLKEVAFIDYFANYIQIVMLHI